MKPPSSERLSAGGGPRPMRSLAPRKRPELEGNGGGSPGAEGAEDESRPLRPTGFRSCCTAATFANKRNYATGTTIRCFYFKFVGIDIGNILRGCAL
jgi:hypothetical protein